MAVYMFAQTMKRMRDSVDVIKKQLSEEMVSPVRYIFTTITELKDIRECEKSGIEAEQIVSMYQCFTDNHSLDCSVKAEDKLNELKSNLQYTYANRMADSVSLVKDGYEIAKMGLEDGENGKYCKEISYYNYTKLLRKEIYTSGIAHVDYYVTAKAEGRPYAKLTRRTFHNVDGSAAYDQIFEEGGKEWFVFPDGSIFTEEQLAAEFIKKLDLSERDMILLDDSVPKEFVQAIFAFGKAARIVILAYAGYGAKGEDKHGLFAKRDYYEWFPYIELIDMMVVSTEKQKKDLMRELKLYHCKIPGIKVSSIDGKFVYVVLYESYGGNLALSWEFKGKADGFFISDEFGKIICETRNQYQHYFLIRGYGKERRFVIKAFADTLRGKVVIAEASLKYCQRQYEKPVVSLIIPAYNAEGYIARTMDNALAQSFLNLEVIVVDDGCTDSTPSILEWYADRYPNVAVIHQENSGTPAAARNTGIEAANGEFIGFMDNDDMIRPNMIKRLYDSAKRNDCDIAMSSVYRMTENGYEVHVRYPLEEDRAFPSENFFGTHYYWTMINSGVVVWNKLYRADLVKNHPFPTFVYDDEAWTPYIFSYADTICYLDEFLYEYDRTIRGGTLLHEWGRQQKDEKFIAYKKTILFFLEKGNAKKAELLKELAMEKASRLVVFCGEEEVGKLRDRIEENF